MKITLKMLLAALLCCLALLALCACGKCEHKETEWVNEIEATCAVAGTRVKTCGACGAELEREQYSTGHQYQGGACIFCGRAELGSDYYQYREITLGGVEGWEIVHFANSTAPTVEVPALRRGKPVLSIAAGAFQDNENITALVVSRNLKRIGDMAFAGCKMLKTVTFHESCELTEIGAAAFAGCEALQAFAFPVGVTAIPDRMFERCTELTTVLLHDGILSLGEDAFSECENIDCSEEGGAKYLGTANVPHLLLVGVADKTVTEFVVPADTRIVGAGAFAGCTLLERLTFSEGVLALGHSALAGCVALQAITLPETLEIIEDGAFAGCTLLQTITLPASTLHIGERAFADCTALSSVILPGGIETVGALAFAGTALTYTESAGGRYLGSAENPHLVLVDAVAGLSALTVHEETRVIANGAMADASAAGALTSVVLGARVRTVGARAFAGCTSLSAVAFPEGGEWLAALSYGAGAAAVSTLDPAENAAKLIGAYKYHYWYRAV